MSWPWQKKTTPSERLAASEGDEVEYCRTVCTLAEEADSLLRWGRRARALEVFKVIAELDADEKTIAPVVDHARRVLEERGIASPPSGATEYDRYLEKLPPHQRYVYLARQFVRRLGSERDAAAAAQARAQAVANFEKAIDHGPLGQRDQRIYAALKVKAGER